MSQVLPRRTIFIGYAPVTLETLIPYLRDMGRPDPENVRPQDVISYILSKEKECIESLPDQKVFLELDLRSASYDPGLTFGVYRRETDSEYDNRVKQNELSIKAEAERVAKRKSNHKANEIKRYKELREKYGDTV